MTRCSYQLSALALAAALFVAKAPAMEIEKEAFGKTSDGEQVHAYTLTNKHGLQVTAMTYGATLISVKVPDRDGKLGEVTLGHDEFPGYLTDNPFFGSTAGRVANRIALGKFTLEGKDYTLATNNGPNHLHGGKQGFDKYVWKAEPMTGDGVRGVKFTHISPDGDEGYPGQVTASVTVKLTDDNELVFDYTATSDKATPINLTNHAYWNLAGTGDVLDHELTLFCDQFLPVDDGLIPTGELKNVEGTPMDFTKSAKIGSRIEQVGKDPTGYDHCYVVRKSDRSPAPCARVYEPTTGRVMEVFTTEPGVQLYTGNFLKGIEGRNGKVNKHYGFCLECQHFPDSINQPKFPNTVLRPGTTYTQTTVHKFSVRK